jgi:ElaB/YqjD/DUF883 family membrane-anchored ribosome-binding protein
MRPHQETSLHREDETRAAGIPSAIDTPTIGSPPTGSAAHRETLDEHETHGRAESGDLSAIRDDLESLTRNLKALVSQTSGMLLSEAKQTSSQVGETIGVAASDFAARSAELGTSASRQARSFAADIETVARNNPLGAIAAALCLGFVVGWSRRGRA